MGHDILRLEPVNLLEAFCSLKGGQLTFSLVGRVRVTRRSEQSKGSSACDEIGLAIVFYTMSPARRLSFSRNCPVIHSDQLL